MTTLLLFFFKCPWYSIHKGKEIKKIVIIIIVSIIIIIFEVCK